MASSRAITAHFSPIMIEGALVLAPGTCRMIEVWAHCGPTAKAAIRLGGHNSTNAPYSAGANADRIV
jgi:hypothetical protein